MEEIWKDIAGFENCYQVSNLGRVKSLQRKQRIKDKILKPSFGKRNYLQINLYKDGRMFKFSIHKLVANAFISNPNNYPCINHKDEDKQNNTVENLEWCDYKYNNSYGGRLNRVSENNCLSKNVLQYTKNEQFIKEWQNARFAIIGNNFFNKDVANIKTIKRAINNCCSGERKTAYGFKWKYK